MGSEAAAVGLLDGSWPRQPFHVAADDELPLDEAATLIEQLASATTSAATAALEQLRSRIPS